jgi:capsular exopolysaccharide synthesis family protein
MSRIDQALERARASRQDEDLAAGIIPEGTPEAELFVGPWELGAQSAPRDVADKRVDPATGRPRPSAPAVITPQARTANFHRDLVEKVVSGTGMPSAAVEQYRKLAAKLHYAQLEHQVKALMVISAVAAEGKTLTSINIALTLSRSYKRKVLVIDADLRRPRLHEAFGVPGISGLHEAVLGETPHRSTVPVFDIGNGVWLLPAGRPTDDPMAVLTSARMREILLEAKRTYEWVIVDTAPLAVLPDAHVLQDAVDAAVLVVSAGRTPYELVERAVGMLGRERILGAVLNGVDEDEMPGSYSYAHYYGQK